MLEYATVIQPFERGSTHRMAVLIGFAFNWLILNSRQVSCFLYHCKIKLRSLDIVLLKLGTEGFYKNIRKL